MRNLITILTLILPAVLLGQGIKINLSPKHSQKLTEIKSGHARMTKYYKYYKKDSIASVKKQFKKARHAWDSARRSGIMALKIDRELTKRGIHGNKQILFGDSLKTKFASYKRVLADSTSSDSARRYAKHQVRRISKNKIDEYLTHHGSIRNNWWPCPT